MAALASWIRRRAVPRVFAAIACAMIPASVLFAAGPNSVSITILHTNDEHAALVPHSPGIDDTADGKAPTSGGVARVATMVERIRAEYPDPNHPVLLLSAGDFTGGGIYSWLTLGGRSCLLELMQQQLGYDVIAIGNHEFDYGPEILAKVLKAAAHLSPVPQTTMLATSLVVPAAHPLAEAGLLQKYRMIALPSGVKIALFSLFGDNARDVTRRAEPITFADPLATARSAVAALKGRGADIIIAITHSGVAEDVALAKALTGIDLIVGGHSHDALFQPLKVQNSWIVQAGERYRYLGRLEVTYDRDLHRIEDLNGRLVPVDNTIPPKKELLPIIAGCTKELNHLVASASQGEITDIHRVLGTSDAPMEHADLAEASPLGDFVADAMRLMVQRKTSTHVDLALMPNGLIRGSLIPGQGASTKGKINFMDLADLVSLGSGPGDRSAGYPLSSVYVTGEELRYLMEVVFIMTKNGGDLYFQQISGARVAYAPALVNILKIPGWNLPVPSGHAVQGIDLYTGQGVQSSRREDYVPLDTKGKRLYHIVMPSYTLSFLPLLTHKLPSLAMAVKDRAGRPFTNLDEAVVTVGGQPYQVWRAAADYLLSSEKKAPSGLPVVDPRYHHTDGRITAVWSLPYWGWAVIAVLLVSVVVRRVWRKWRYGGCSCQKCKCRP